MLGGISIWQLLILLAIVVMVFGTKRLRNLGGDLGGALKDFRGAMKSSEDDDDAHKKTTEERSDESRVIDQDDEGRGAGPGERHDADKPSAGDRHS